MPSKSTIVSISLGNETIRVGQCYFHQKHGRESASFEYDELWLKHPERFPLEPALRLIEGTFHTRKEFAIFGAIGDSAPDRWGRRLMRRAHISEKKSTLKNPFKFI